MRTYVITFKDGNVLTLTATTHNEIRIIEQMINFSSDIGNVHYV